MPALRYRVAAKRCSTKVLEKILVEIWLAKGLVRGHLPAVRVGLTAPRNLAARPAG